MTIQIARKRNETGVPPGLPDFDHVGTRGRRPGGYVLTMQWSGRGDGWRDSLDYWITVHFRMVLQMANDLTTNVATPSGADPSASYSVDSFS